MVLTDEELGALFEYELAQEVAGLTEASGVDPEQWRAGGRASKAWPNKENGAWWRANGADQVIKYAQWREQTAHLLPLWETPAGLPAIEVEINVAFRSVPVKMFIDRVFVVAAEGTLVVVDLKSGGREPETAHQLGFYASGMEALWGIRPQYGAYYMTRKAALTPFAPLDHYSIDQLGRELEEFNRAVDAGIFLPRRGSHCKSCGVARACAAVGGPEAQRYDRLHPLFADGKVYIAE